MSDQPNLVNSGTETAPPKPKKSKAKSQIMASEVLNGAFQRTIEAKERGEKIGWATSLFPQEIAETLGLNIVYPENHGASLAAKKIAPPFLEYSEEQAFRNALFLIVYVRVLLAKQNHNDKGE